MNEICIGAIADWINDIFAYEEKPTKRYTLKDASIDLEEHRKHFADDALLKLSEITPEQYRDAMNYNIAHVWKSAKVEYKISELCACAWQNAIISVGAVIGKNEKEAIMEWDSIEKIADHLGVKFDVNGNIMS